MAVQIGHAYSDESGGIEGAQPGDQTGKEIRLEDWYNRSKQGGWPVYMRCTDTALADRAAAIGVQICESDAFGYSQRTRSSGYKAIMANGGKVAGAAKSNFDCSSLIDAMYRLAGLSVTTGSTHNLERRYLATGLFESFRDAAHLTKPDYAERGGLYLAPGKHVAFVVNNGPLAQPADPDPPDSAATDEPYVLVIGGNVHVRSGPSKQTKKLGTVHRGARLFYHETDADTGWYWVDTEFGTGCISSRKDLTALIVGAET